MIAEIQCIDSRWASWFESPLGPCLDIKPSTVLVFVITYFQALGPYKNVKKGDWFFLCEHFPDVNDVKSVNKSVVVLGKNPRYMKNQTEVVFVYCFILCV